jgi:hypothetical protein
MLPCNIFIVCFRGISVVCSNQVKPGGKAVQSARSLLNMRAGNVNRVQMTSNTDYQAAKILLYFQFRLTNYDLAFSPAGSRVLLFALFDRQTDLIPGAG